MRPTDRDATGRTATDRAVSPVVGAALLIGITVLLGTVLATVLFGVGVGPADTPEVTLSFQVTDGGSTIVLIHEGGEPLAPGEVVVRDETGTAVHTLGDELATGDREPMPVGVGEVERLTVVWQNPRGDGETVLATFEP